MSRVIPTLKRRNSDARDAYHRRARFNRYMKVREEELRGLRNLFRKDATTGEVSVVGRSTLNSEIGFFPRDFGINQKLAPYASAFTVIWEQLEQEATFCGDKATYWLEKIADAR